MRGVLRRLSRRAQSDRDNSLGRDGLMERELERFRCDGFLVVEKLTTVADIQTIRHTLDNLFQETPTSEYLFRPSRFAPELLDTLAFRQCWRIARQVLGITALRSFDSAIYKHPHKDSGTPWHQDQAYNKTHRESSAPLPTVHF